ASAALGPVLAEGEADVHGTAVAEADRLLRHPLGNARIGGIGGGLTTCGLLHRDPCRARLLVLGADLQDRASAEEDDRRECPDGGAEPRRARLERRAERRRGARRCPFPRRWRGHCRSLRLRLLGYCESVPGGCGGFGRACCSGCCGPLPGWLPAGGWP